MFFYGGLILFILSVNVPFNRTLILIFFLMRQEIEAQVKGEGEVEKSRHEGCRDFIVSVKKVPYRYLSTEIVNLKWGSTVRKNNALY